MTAQQKLDEALQVRHQLMLGKAKASLGFGDRSITYTQATRKDLDAYIAELRREIGGRTASRSRVRYAVPD